MAWIFGGLVLGAALSALFVPWLSSLLFGVRPMDAVTFAGVAIFLAVVGMLACYLPARRALRTDPIVVLRYE
jgi:putative ABC transport system permease protein